MDYNQIIKRPTIPRLNGSEMSDFELALKQYELLGVILDDIFKDYEELRCVKCTCDTITLKIMQDDQQTSKNNIILVVPTKLERRQSKNKNNYYKLHCLDEYGSTYFYLRDKVYQEHCNEIIMEKPLMIMLKLKNGNANISYCKNTHNISSTVAENIIIYTDSYDKELEVRDLLAQFKLGSTLVSFNDKKPILSIKTTWSILRLLKSFGLKFNLNYTPRITSDMFPDDWSFDEVEEEVIEFNKEYKIKFLQI